MLPDGKPIVVRCKQVEQATTDPNGALGFAAPLQAGVAPREQRWTYNQFGQVLSYDGPRTDIQDIETYTYYADTQFVGTGATAVGYTVGDLASVTNAAGQTTRFTKYNKTGQNLESIDPNGVATTRTYDMRQRMTSVTVASETTVFEYLPTGSLKRVTFPDASFVGYSYDAAQRLTSVSDNLGNSITYTLDNASNRTAEEVKDASGALRRQLLRSFDALGRVQQLTGRQ